MFTGAANKALVAALMGVLIILDQVFGIRFEWLSEQWITSLLAVISPILVYFVRNR